MTSPKRKRPVTDQEGKDESEDEETPQLEGEEEEAAAKPAVELKKKPFSCSNCPKSFASKQGLQYHERQKVCVKDKPKRPKGPKKPKQYACPDCDKAFSSEQGRDYHVNKKVCQRKALEESLPPEKKKKEGPNRRGPESERTCGDCKRVFSTREGLAYHVKNKVCKNGTSVPSTKRRKKGTQKDRTCPHCGKMFTVWLGYDYHVNNKVCRKTKAPTAQLSFDALEEGLKFVTPFGVVQVLTDDRQEPTETELSVKEAARRRSKIMSNRQDRQKRCFATNSIESRLRRKKLAELYNQGKHEDRNEIFNVCYHGYDPTTDEQPRGKSQAATKSGDPLVPPELCPDRIVECILVPDERHVVRDLDNDEVQESNDRSIAPMRLYLKRCELNKPYQADVVVYPCADCGTKFFSKEGIMYHTDAQVCINKGKQTREQTQDRLNSSETTVMTRLKQDQKRKSKKRRTEEKDDKGFIGNQKFQDPNVTMAALEAEYAKAQAILNQPIPIYSVRKKKKKKRRRKAVSGAASSDQQPRPVIDTSVLVDEVDAGRYPSMRRHDGEHSDVCAACHEKGFLHCCDFCSNAVHMPCMLAKLRIREPDPDEDFMCFKCMQYILARRARAEKRRLQMCEDFEEDQDNPYHIMAQKAREVSELKELLMDAQGRLEQAMETTNIFKMRHEQAGLGF